MRNLFSVKLRENEAVICRIKSHWYYYFVSLIFLPMAIYDTFLIPIILYTLLLALWQEVVITNRRVICRGGWFFIGICNRKKGTGEGVGLRIFIPNLLSGG